MEIYSLDSEKQFSQSLLIHL